VALAQDPRAVRRARRRVLQLYEAGQLAVWVDASHSFQGLAAVPDAVEHMLRGGHIGKVVVPL
jgi:NADPH-dependent curcumin reductase CurA